MRIMEKGRRLLRWTGVIATVAVLTGWSVGVFGVEQQAGGVAMEKRADIITIDAMQAFGRLERPPVVYRHDRHTEVLGQKRKDCTVCHLKDEKGVMSLKFQRLQDADRDTVMNVYHDNCISCHVQTMTEGEKAGPVTCGECHVKTPAVMSSWTPIGMDKSLHFRHSSKLDKKCELCHHEYNPETKQLFYAKGQEGSCRYCHKEQTEENRISMREAAHQDCVACHRETKAQNAQAEVGPIFCAGCHDPQEQLAIAKVENPARMERNQPNVIFVKTTPKSAAQPDEAVRAKAVPFNHKAHEQYNDTCRVCHHASMSACVECHTVLGSKDGDFVKLEDAMHRFSADASCLGCHTQRQADKACAGCHAFIRKGLKQDPQSCLTCHEEGAPSAADLKGTPDEQMLAAMLLEARTPVRGTYPIEDIPEKVVIKKLADQYEAVEMPHRKIVQALVKGIAEDNLAAYYHRDPGTVCQGCHHNQPVSKKPSQCASCHGKPFEAGNLFQPGLLGAYHIQCMGCHQEMGIVKPAGCTECHKAKQS
jgi:hypothetical protein